MTPRRIYHVSLDRHCVILNVGRQLDDKSTFQSTIHKCLLCPLLFQTSGYAYLPCIRAARPPELLLSLESLYRISLPSCRRRVRLIRGVHPPCWCAPSKWHLNHASSNRSTFLGPQAGVVWITFSRLRKPPRHRLTSKRPKHKH